MPTSSALLPGLMMSIGRPSPGRADPSGNISTPWMRLPGAQPARRYRSSSPGRIRPHIPVFDKSARDDGTFARGDFDYNQEADIYICPAGKVLTSTGTLVNDGATLLYRASKYDCDGCELKPRCCPKMPARKVPRS